LSELKEEKELSGRGRSLYLAVSRSAITNKEVARKAGYKENTFYSHIRKPDLSFNILSKYGKVLRYDFSIEFPEMSLDFPLEEDLNYQKLNSKDYQILQEKYFRLLEKHNALLEQYHSLLEAFNEKK